MTGFGRRTPSKLEGGWQNSSTGRAGRMIQALFNQIPGDTHGMSEGLKEKFGPRGPFQDMDYMACCITAELLSYGEHVLVWRTFPSKQSTSKQPFFIKVDLNICFLKLMKGLSMTVIPGLSSPSPQTGDLSLGLGANFFDMKRDDFRKNVLSEVVSDNVYKKIVSHGVKFQKTNLHERGNDDVDRYLSGLNGLYFATDLFLVIFFRSFAIRFFQLCNHEISTGGSLTPLLIGNKAWKFDDSLHEISVQLTSVCFTDNKKKGVEYLKSLKKRFQWEKWLNHLPLPDLTKFASSSDDRKEADSQTAWQCATQNLHPLISEALRDPIGYIGRKQTHTVVPVSITVVSNGWHWCIPVESEPSFQFYHQLQEWMLDQEIPDLRGALYLFAKTGILSSPLMQHISAQRFQLNTKIGNYQRSVATGVKTDVDESFKEASDHLRSISSNGYNPSSIRSAWMDPLKKE